jgi:hypothetical protein
MTGNPQDPIREVPVTEIIPPDLPQVLRTFRGLYYLITGTGSPPPCPFSLHAGPGPVYPDSSVSFPCSRS